jgi:hypothetical protein
MDSFEDTQRWSKLLIALGRKYPDEISLDAFASEAGDDRGFASALFDHLAESGLVELHRTSRPPATRVRLSERGMAVAFGLASAADGARGVIERLEAATVKEIQRQRSRRAQTVGQDESLKRALSRWENEGGRPARPVVVPATVVQLARPSGGRATRLPPPWWNPRAMKLR